jgi:hypothetical protein
MHAVKVPQFYFSVRVGVGENDIFIFPLFPMCSHHIAYNLTMGSHHAPNMLPSFQHVFPNMFPMILIYYPRHIGKWHPPLFLFPLYSQWVPKRISTFFVFPMCSQHPSYNNSSWSHMWWQMLSPFCVLKWSKSRITSCASKFWGVSIMYF